MKASEICGERSGSWGGGGGYFTTQIIVFELCFERVTYLGTTRYAKSFEAFRV